RLDCIARRPWRSSPRPPRLRARRRAARRARVGRDATVRRRRSRVAAASHAARNDGRLSPRAHLAHRRSGARRGERATSDRNAVKATHLAGDPPTALFPNWEAVVLPLIRIEAEDLVGDIVQLDPHRQLLSALEVRYFGTAHD